MRFLVCESRIKQVVISNLPLLSDTKYLLLATPKFIPFVDEVIVGVVPVVEDQTDVPTHFADHTLAPFA